MSTLERQPAPARLVDNGTIRFGVFDGPVDSPNLWDAHAPLGVPLPRALQDLRLKEWQAMQLGNDRFFMVVAIFSAKTVALVQIKVFDRVAGRKHLFERKVAPWKARVARGLRGTRTEWSSRGATMSFTNDFDRGRIDFEVDIPPRGDSPRFVGKITAATNKADSMVVSLPFGENRGMYSHKGCFPATGSLKVGEQCIDLREDNGFALLDDHKGYYPYVMRWDWLTAARFTAGSRVAFNLTRNDNIAPERYNENALFIDGEIEHLPPVHFERHGEGAGEYWTVRDADGRVDVRFDVVLDGRVSLNALIVESRYRGPFGEVSGTITRADGTPVDLTGAFGMAEDFYLRT